MDLFLKASNIQVEFMGNRIHKAYGDRIIFDDAQFSIPLGAKAAITGTNGAGKTTLLNMIMERDSSIYISPKAVIGYYRQNSYHLNGNESIMEYLNQDCDYKESVLRSMLVSLGFHNGDLKKQVNVLSGGEKVKCQLCKLLTGRYNVLILDEPGNYLDLHSILALERFMKDYPGTILFVSHDSRLISNVATRIYHIGGGRIECTKGGYAKWS